MGVYAGQIRLNPILYFGKQEPLKENLTGFWSFGIDDTHRLI
ncbi:MAG: hypothetical protein CL866_06620 [Cycloclasticus sp.]|nr:hypothetical protein [Cycloclasticus sp.]MBG96528.1 hypothetical protein [Cycloclasticus sp.]